MYSRICLKPFAYAKIISFIKIGFLLQSVSNQCDLIYQYSCFWFDILILKCWLVVKNDWKKMILLRLSHKRLIHSFCLGCPWVIYSEGIQLSCYVDMQADLWKTEAIGWIMLVVESSGRPGRRARDRTTYPYYPQVPNLQNLWRNECFIDVG